jgi:predicted alpha/beta hydrolase family esterase
MTASDTLIIPGWGNSGPGYWQSLWAEDLPNATRVEQREWINVALDDWVDTLNHYVRDCRALVVLVAYSLSCILIEPWASRCATSRVQAALLVAPTDVEDANTVPPELPALRGTTMLSSLHGVVTYYAPQSTN